jgi:hypothetical protein
LKHQATLFERNEKNQRLKVEEILLRRSRKLSRRGGVPLSWERNGFSSKDPRKREFVDVWHNRFLGEKLQMLH